MNDEGLDGAFASRDGGGGGGVVPGSDFVVGGAGVEEFSGKGEGGDVGGGVALESGEAVVVGGGGGVVVEGRDGGEVALERERVEFIVMVLKFLSKSNLHNTLFDT
ncbi:uncharacterized protein G2W53_015892 [Senna tora]|uniref:Uncharacterized protein n=1 Tax=Senna tora TaxID=362788 RepID=A0A834WW50_9FABA|nr:uncharacterized protein G2W53_015892 [Senna tora]